MQVVILCGGRGSRIRDLGRQLPKPLIPIGDHPILWHIMQGYARYGFKDFVLCLGYKGKTIKRYFQKYGLPLGDFPLNPSPPALDWQVTLVDSGLGAMTGCRVKRAEPYLAGDTFMLTYGDGLADVDLDALLAFHRGHGRLATVTAVRPPSRFGEIEMDGERVVEFNEKPAATRRRVNGGFFVFQRRFLDRLGDNPELVLEQGPLRQLARDGELMAYRHDGFWQPMDTAAEHAYLCELWASGRAPWMTWSEVASCCAA
jgi:glucose-1-phosphate cytidylyltransferase